MNWYQILFGQLSSYQTTVCCIRIVIAVICGGLIGIERSKNFKEAGIRTHIIVCCGACLCMLVSKYGFADLLLPTGELFPGVKEADPARIAAQVISGISFIGAGLIFRREGFIRGLTTAAGIWLTAGIGLTVGGGLIFLALFVTLFVLCVQTIMHHFTFGADAYSNSTLHFKVKNGYKFNKTLQAQLSKWEATVIESSYDRNEEEGTTDYDLVVRRKTPIEYSELRDFVESHPEVLSSRNGSTVK